MDFYEGPHQKHEKIKEHLYSLIQNRVKLLTVAIMGIGIISNNPDIVLIGMLGSMGTREQVTSYYYKKTKKHLNKHNNHIKENFFRAIIMKNGGKNAILMSYCGLQGVYLAMKEQGLEAEFRELKKKYSLLILPNF